MPARSIPTPVGPVTLREAGGEIVSLEWRGGHDDRSDLLDRAAGQVADYFAGTRRAFELPLAVGTGATAAFLRALIAIPFGETRSYGNLAKALGVGAQAVGQMCRANRLAILIPCHRVLGASTLGGFSAPGRIETTVALLRHEGAAGLLI